MRYIDSHVHIWELERGDYTWLPKDNKVLYQNYSIHEINEHFPQQIAGIVLVQAAQTLAETQYMLDCAERDARIVGVVGGLDPSNANYKEQYEQVKDHRYFKGLRFNGSSFHQSEQASDLYRAMEGLQEAGHVLDLLVRPSDLSTLLPFLEKFPDLTVVINHLGIPPYHELDKLNEWETGMRRLAALPQVNCKISGMITQSKGCSLEEVSAWVLRLNEWFGPSRLLYGSDWPVALQGGDYVDVLGLFEGSLPETWKEDEKVAVRAGNATRLYRLV